MLRPWGWNMKPADYTCTAYVCALQRESRVLWWPVYVGWTGPDRTLPGSSLRISQVSVVFPGVPVARGTQQRLSQRLVTAMFNSRLEASLGPRPSSSSPPQRHLKVAIPSMSDTGDQPAKFWQIPLSLVNHSEFTCHCVTCDECIVFTQDHG